MQTFLTENLLYSIRKKFMNESVKSTKVSQTTKKEQSKASRRVNNYDVEGITFAKLPVYQLNCHNTVLFA